MARPRSGPVEARRRRLILQYLLLTVLAVVTGVLVVMALGKG